MDIKLTLSVLISGAYFLALFIFNIFRVSDLFRNLLKSSGCAAILFVAIYLLLLYIDFSFENLKKNESKSALDKIRELELNTNNKYLDTSDYNNSNIEKVESIKSTSLINKNTDTDESSAYKNQDLNELKRATGTQFDKNYMNNSNIDI